MYKVWNLCHLFISRFSTRHRFQNGDSFAIAVTSSLRSLRTRPRWASTVKRVVPSVMPNLSRSSTTKGRPSSTITSCPPKVAFIAIQNWASSSRSITPSWQGGEQEEGVALPAGEAKGEAQVLVERRRERSSRRTRCLSWLPTSCDRELAAGKTVSKWTFCLLFVCLYFGFSRLCLLMVIL